MPKREKAICQQQQKMMSAKKCKIAKKKKTFCHFFSTKTKGSSKNPTSFAFSNGKISISTLIYETEKV